MTEIRRLENIIIFSKLLLVLCCPEKFITVVVLIFSQFAPICVPKNLENAPAQVLSQSRH